MGSVTFKAGFEVEDRVRTRLAAIGCKLEADEKLNHQHKLDFVITRMPENTAFHAVGVQVTTNLDNADKMEEFNRENKDSRVTQYALYLELGSGLDMENGGGLAVLLVLGDFIYNRKRSGKIGAVRIYGDLTYEFFDIEDRICNLRKARVAPRVAELTASAPVIAPQPVAVAAVPAPVVTPAPVAPAPVKAPVVSAATAAARLDAAFHNDGKMFGMLKEYSRERGYGFIISQTGEKFFFHRSRITSELKQKLDQLPMDMHRDLSIDVKFKDMGINKPGSVYPEAQEITPLTLN